MAFQGSAPCWEPGCEGESSTQCSYIDNRMQRCELVVCPDHELQLGEKAYCRRHAGTLNAIFGDLSDDDVATGEKRFLPEINSRAASLANWVGTDLDADIRHLLEETMAELGGEVRTEPVRDRFINRAGGRKRRWEREWKLFDQTGVLLRVAIGVDEAMDDEVVVAVDASEVDRATPPWIANRTSAEAAPSDDAAIRAAFYSDLKDAIRKGIGYSRSLANR